MAEDDRVDLRFWSGPRPTGPRGFLAWHGPMKSEGESRVAVRKAKERLAGAKAVLRKRLAEREAATRMRDERFSKESMKYMANTAALGLNFANLDELRSFKFSPPPIVQLVMRCVCTLISGDDIGDAEALEAEEAARRPLTARSDSGGARKPHTAQARLEAARERLARANSGKDPPVRRSDVRRGNASALVSWETALQLMRRADFKFRLLNLNGKALLDNTELVEAVRACLDLSSIKPNQPYTILPGRAHPGHRDEERRARRELTSSLYTAHAEKGVAAHTEGKLQFEEARYTSEIAGAMLIWIQRVFAQHDQLRRAWDESCALIAAAHASVIPAKRKVDELQDLLDEIKGEYRTARVDLGKAQAAAGPKMFTNLQPSQARLQPWMLVDASVSQYV